MGFSVCLRKDNPTTRNRRHVEQESGNQILRMYAERDDKPLIYAPRACEPSGLCGVAVNAGAVSESEAQSLSELWRPRNNCLQRMAGRYIEFLEGYGSFIRTWTVARPSRQYAGILQRELSVDNAENANAEYSEKLSHRHPYGENAYLRSGRSFWDRLHDAALSAAAWLADKTSIRPAGSRPKNNVVYDILNCGPRHRFAVLDQFGRTVIVSNCTQAIARDFMAQGMLNLDKAGYEVCLSVHDEALAYRTLGEGSVKEFCELLEKLPAWAQEKQYKDEFNRTQTWKACPIAAEGWVGTRYRK
jgi:hypothetical protein